jgi:micrococcal nuclease
MELLKLKQLKTELNKCTTKNTNLFTFENREFLCKCIKVYDGDTITVAFKPFYDEDSQSGDNTIYKYNIRLSGIDTPEIRTKNLDEKKKGLEIRDTLREKILDKLVIIKCSGFDKYGRLLAFVYDENNSNINQWLIDNGFAYNYSGGTKQPFNK